MAENFPSTTSFVTSSFNLLWNTQTFGNGVTQQMQRKSTSGARWTATYTIRPMKRADYAEWQAFFATLQGRLNTFNAYDPNGTSPRGVGTGTPLVNGASQTGTSLITDGWTSGQTGIMKKGDYFSVNGELKIMTSDVNSDGSGNATLTFQPPLRNSPDNNAPITVNTASCEMYLMTDQIDLQLNNVNVSQPIIIQGIEAIS